jgi:hypothetical protein
MHNLEFGLLETNSVDDDLAQMKKIIVQQLFGTYSCLDPQITVTIQKNILKHVLSANQLHSIAYSNKSTSYKFCTVNQLHRS